VTRGGTLSHHQKKIEWTPVTHRAVRPEPFECLYGGRQKSPVRSDFKHEIDTYSNKQSWLNVSSGE
jgi:hypothetical protein